MEFVTGLEDRKVKTLEELEREESVGTEVTVEGMDHTTYAHTGAMVNLYAMGVGAEKFGGVYDNTEVFHKLAELTGVQ